LWPFGIFYGHLIYFPPLNQKNLAAPLRDHPTRCIATDFFFKQKWFGSSYEKRESNFLIKFHFAGARSQKTNFCLFLNWLRVLRRLFEIFKGRKEGKVQKVLETLLSPFDETSVDKMSVDKMSVDKMSIQ
jgi:hypothetical protein